MIGDGMSEAHIYAAITQAGYALYLEQFPFSGFQKTFSYSNYITDSAAGGTALATGVKTKNGVIGQDTLGNALRSILHIAHDKGLSTGIVASCALTHATPASFIANQPNRNMYEEIAADYLKTQVDVIIGGGYNHFAVRKDGQNLIDTFKNKGYVVIDNPSMLDSSKSGKLAAILYPIHPPKYSEGREDMLPDATSKAIELLGKNKNGFFLMVEGSQIDWGGHDNDLQYIMDEMLDFDRAVGRALDFARKDGNTLVVVTSDHETGGMTIIGGNIENKEVKAAFSTKGHSAGMVPVFSFGPGAEMFSGIIDNSAFFEKFMLLYGFSGNQE